MKSRLLVLFIDENGAEQLTILWRYSCQQSAKWTDPLDVLGFSELEAIYRVTDLGLLTGCLEHNGKRLSFEALPDSLNGVHLA